VNPFLDRHADRVSLALHGHRGRREARASTTASFSSFRSTC